MFTTLKELYGDWSNRKEKRKRWADRSVNLTWHALDRFKQDTKNAKPKAPTTRTKVKNIFLESDKVGEYHDNSYYANRYGIFVEKNGDIVTFVGTARMDDENYVGMYHRYQKETA